MASIQLASMAEKRKGRSVSPRLGARAVWVGRLNRGWILCSFSGWAGVRFMAGTLVFSKGALRRFRMLKIAEPILYNGKVNCMIVMSVCQCGFDHGVGLWLSLRVASRQAAQQNSYDELAVRGCATGGQFVIFDAFGNRGTATDCRFDIFDAFGNRGTATDCRFDIFDTFGNRGATTDCRFVRNTTFVV